MSLQKRNTRIGLLSLLFLAATVWALVAIQFRGYIVADRRVQSHPSSAEALPTWIDDTNRVSTFVGDFRDPFSHIERQSRSNVEIVPAAISESASEWPPMTLKGVVGQTVLLAEEEDAFPLYLAKGDSLFGAVIDRVFSDSVYVRYGTETRTLRVDSNLQISAHDLRQLE